MKANIVKVNTIRNGIKIKRKYLQIKGMTV